MGKITLIFPSNEENRSSFPYTNSQLPINKLTVTQSGRQPVCEVPSTALETKAVPFSSKAGEERSVVGHCKEESKFSN